MRVLLVGHFSSSLDEGVRNVGKYIARELEKTEIDIKTIDISSIFKFRDINSFNPDIMHFILSPTTIGLVVVKLFSLIFPRVKIVVSAIHPSIHQNGIIRVLRPDLLLVQSYDSENLFESFGFETQFLLNGVDTNKFMPVDSKAKNDLRVRYGIPLDKFVILHLASLKKQRNLYIFSKLSCQKNILVLIIGREDEDLDQRLKDDLVEMGCLVWVKHFPNIEDIYNLSDCYMFPTIDKEACIETPLSILEAMACDLPIITTRFGSLPRTFRDVPGLIFIHIDEIGGEDVNKYINLLNSKRINIQTRNAVLDYSWENLTKKLENIYKELL